MKEKIYIVGAGIAGLSAAYHALKKGHRDIEIFESCPFAGGRCRSFHDEKLNHNIDNGNHLILAANTNLFEIIDGLGVRNRFYAPESGFNFYNHKTKANYSFNPPFLNFKQYGKEVLSFYRFMFLGRNKTVKESFDDAPELYERLINPISRSILNTESEVADSTILRNVFLKIIRKGKKGFKYYYPDSWDEALIKPLTEHLKDKGVTINYNYPIKSFWNDEEKITAINTNDGPIDTKDAKIILATPAFVTSKLINVETPEDFNPIINIHFKFEHDIKPGIRGVINSYIEWIFFKKGMISTTYSAGNDIVQENEELLAREAWGVISDIYGFDKMIPPYRVIKEKRATFSCTKENLDKRPDHRTKYSNLFLAGDYVDNGLPGTIEGAVFSGKIAATML